MRWDDFGPINETNGGQANFVPAPVSGTAIGAATYIIPARGKDNRTLSTGHPAYTNSAGVTVPAAGGSCAGIGCYGFVDLLAKDGIALLSTNRYGQGLLRVERGLIAPRFGADFEVTPKLVLRGGIGLFYNSFENQGYGPNVGENYPFVYNLNYTPQSNPSGPSIASQVAPISYNSPYAGCGAAGPGGTANFESGFTCIPLTSGAVNALGVGLQGLQFDYATPRTLSANFTVQYALTRTLTAQAAYVYTHGADLQGGVGYQNITQILPAGIDTKNCGKYAVYPDGSCVPFKDFGSGSYQATYGISNYDGLQTKVEEQFANGLTFLFTYTYSKTLSDAGDLLNGGSTGGLRAYNIPGLGPKFDYTLADFDLRQVFPLQRRISAALRKRPDVHEPRRHRQRHPGRLGDELDPHPAGRATGQLHLPDRGHLGRGTMRRYPDIGSKSATRDQEPCHRRRSAALLGKQCQGLHAGL